jgi:asparagine synthase (glutamine-hydrolysing)
MCGIAGVVGVLAPQPALLERMGQRMVHRGPDSQGIWSDMHAGLVIRRLAIIDLDERSNQPLHHGPWHLVFNGEIYNYRELRVELMGLGHEFLTEGDGEVLLHAWVQWREGALERLNGMFAVAIWNDEEQELVCVRDPFGEKPLLWTNSSEGFVFGSEARSILAARPNLTSPRAPAVARYLSLGPMPRIEETFFAGINQLPGGHLLRLREGKLTIRRYWSPGRVDVPTEYPKAVEELRHLLADSISLRLRADVVVGTSLSGGVDSSALVATAGRIAGDHRRHAFTARFPGFDRDEWRYADIVARSAGVLEHHPVEPTSAGLLARLDEVVRYQEEPFGSSSIYAQWCVMAAAREAGVTVLLDGQGADELFGGYQGSNGWAIRSQGFGSIIRSLASKRDRTATVLALASGGLPAGAARWARRRRTTPYASRLQGELLGGGSAPARGSNGLTSPMARELLRQSLHTSMPALLRYADRNSMAHSREVRLPFLDRRVAEYALSLPSEWLYRDGVTKAVLRDAVRGLVPDAILDRRDKIGYETPQRKWLEEPRWISRIREVLLDDRARNRDLYSTDLIEADARAGRWRDIDGIWRALNLELWLTEFERA